MTNRSMSNHTTRTFARTAGTVQNFKARRLAVAALATGTLATAGVAAADEPTASELLDQIAALQQQVERIEAQEAAKAKAEAEQAEQAAKAESVDAAFDRVLADADRRSSPQPLFAQVGDDPEPFTGGHDGKFVLRSADGNFELNPNFQIQARFVANIAGENGDAFEDTDFGWEMRRVKFGFKGHAFSPDLTYDITFGVDRSEGAPILETAYIDYTPDNGLFNNDNLGFRIGQYKDPTFHEETTSSKRQLAVDRSLVNEELGGGVTDFVQGVGLLYKGEKFKGYIGYVDGFASRNTNFNRRRRLPERPVRRPGRERHRGQLQRPGRPGADRRGRRPLRGLHGAGQRGGGAADRCGLLPEPGRPRGRRRVGRRVRRRRHLRPRLQLLPAAHGRRPVRDRGRAGPVRRLLRQPLRQRPRRRHRRRRRGRHRHRRLQRRPARPGRVRARRGERLGDLRPCGPDLPRRGGHPRRRRRGLLHRAHRRRQQVLGAAQRQDDDRPRLPPQRPARRRTGPINFSSNSGIGLRNSDEFEDQVAIRGQFQLLF